MKRTSGAAYLAERDMTEKLKPQPKIGWAARTVNSVAQLPSKKPLFEPLLSSPVETASVVAKVWTDDMVMMKDKTGAPKCSWWKFMGDAVPEKVEGDTLELSGLKGVPVVALVARLPVRETVDDAATNTGYTTAKMPSPWTAKLLQKEQDLVRIRRPEGLRSTGVWLVATLRQKGELWTAEAVDELYPEKRLEAVLQLRFKEFIKKEEEAPSEDPMEATRRMLAEAMG